jgi:hypothetical protein
MLTPLSPRERQSHLQTILGRSSSLLCNKRAFRAEHPILKYQRATSSPPSAQTSQFPYPRNNDNDPFIEEKTRKCTMSISDWNHWIPPSPAPAPVLQFQFPPQTREPQTCPTCRPLVYETGAPVSKTDLLNSAYCSICFLFRNIMAGMAGAEQLTAFRLSQQGLLAWRATAKDGKSLFGDAFIIPAANGGESP